MANKNCHIQKIVRVDETTHKIGKFFDVIHRPQSPIFSLQIKSAPENEACRRKFIKMMTMLMMIVIVID